MIESLEEAWQIVGPALAEHIAPRRAPIVVVNGPLIDVRIPPAANPQKLAEAWNLIVAALKTRNGRMPIAMGRRAVRA